MSKPSLFQLLDQVSGENPSSIRFGKLEGATRNDHDASVCFKVGIEDFKNILSKKTTPILVLVDTEQLKK